MNATIRHRFGVVTARCVFLSAFVAAPPLDAQEEQYQLIDGVIAVVGSTPIARSRIEEQLQMLRLQDPELPTDSATLNELSRLILDTLIIEELLIQAAERDTTIFVIEEDVQSRADDQLRTIRDAFVSELDFQRGCGLTTVLVLARVCCQDDSAFSCEETPTSSTRRSG